MSGTSKKAIVTKQGVETIEQALELARQCKYGPLPKPTDPTPTIAEAIQIIGNDPTMRASNRANAQDAIEVLWLAKGSKFDD